MTATRHTTEGFGSRDPGIDEASFKRLAAILHGECGIVLSESKKSLAVSRLSRRLRELRLPDFKRYCDLLESGGSADERREMVCLLTTNVTNFFREGHHFEALKNDILPVLVEKARRGERVRLWSAGCSSGQEPYSIAISLLEACPDIRRHDVRILATDIDANMVQTGRAGIYRDLDKAHVSPDRLKKFFDARPAEGNMWQANSALQSLVTFAELNLIRDWPMRGPFDVIFCRNVVIYFDAETQAKLWTRFAQILSPGGHLFVGHSERVSGPATSGLKLAGTTQYLKT
ncbi:CheR family methyltransferase [Marinibacterium profundimaris]|uniref:CheR family methyltransferase n=1 Tax=Marinibacterium profundimaris TaxID=1679460 RepID=UPI000B5250A6|nr:protein-glutamate O-methyltransferase [Marinibacterium profundimaris]